MSYKKSKLVRLLLKQTVGARSETHASHRDTSSLGLVK